LAFKDVASGERIYEKLGKPPDDLSQWVEWSELGDHPFVDPAIPKKLRRIRGGIHLRWNRAAVVVKEGHYEATGVLRAPEYEPRWELWDVDQHGSLYMITRLQTNDGGFLPADNRVVRLMERQARVIETFDGDPSKAIEAQVDLTNAAMQVMAEKDRKDYYDRFAAEVANYYTVKNIGYRGIRPFSGTGKLEDVL